MFFRRACATNRSALIGLRHPEAGIVATAKGQSRASVPSLIKSKMAISCSAFLKGADHPDLQYLLDCWRSMRTVRLPSNRNANETDRRQLCQNNPVAKTVAMSAARRSSPQANCANINVPAIKVRSRESRPIESERASDACLPLTLARLPTFILARNFL
jgi:hypothetical protein